MARNIAFALPPELSDRAGHVKWPLRVAGALAAAAAIIYLASGSSLTFPEEVVAAPVEVKATVHEIDEFESQKKAALIEDLPPQF